MSIVAMTGFELGTTAQLMLYSGPSASSHMWVDTNKRTGTYGLHLQGGGDANYFWIWNDLSIAGTLYFSFAVYPDDFWQATGTPYVDIEFYIDSGHYVGLRYYDQYIHARVNGSTVASGTRSLINGWNSIQAGFIIADSGNIYTKVNGVADISYSGDTKPGASTTVTGLRLSPYGGATWKDIYFDDVMIKDNDWAGDIRIVKLSPTADTATKNWTPSTGSDNYAMLDEIPYSDSDYNSSTTNGQQDLYDVEDFSGTGRTPQGICVWSRAWKDPSNSQQLKLLAKAGSTTSTSSAFNLPPSASSFVRNVWSLNPDDSQPWEDADLDGLQVGIESVI